MRGLPIIIFYRQEPRMSIKIWFFLGLMGGFWLEGICSLLSKYGSSLMPLQYIYNRADDVAHILLCHAGK